MFNLELGVRLFDGKRLGSMRGNNKQVKRSDEAVHAAAAASHPTVSDTDISSGDRVRHAHWGDGVVREVVGEGDRAEAVVAFDEGDKRLLLAWAPLEKQ